MRLRGELHVRAEILAAASHRPARRAYRTTPCTENDDRRYLREDAIDQRLVLSAKPDRRAVGVLKLVRAAHDDAARQPAATPERWRSGAPEAEARSNLLLDRAVQHAVDRPCRRARGSRNVARTRYSVKPVADSSHRREPCGMQADAREEIDRPVLAEQVPACQIDERAGRQLELLLRRRRSTSLGATRNRPSTPPPYPSVVGAASSTVTSRSRSVSSPWRSSVSCGARRNSCSAARRR